MKKNVFLLLLALLYFPQLNATDTIYVKQWTTAGPFALRQPIINDTVNITGSKYENKSLLGVKVSPEAFTTATSLLNADGNNEAQLQSAEKTPALTLLSFHLTAEAFTKANFIVKTPHMVEVYVDGKQSGSKTSEEASLQEAKTTNVALKLEPKTYRIDVKYLITAGKEETTPAIQAYVTTDKESPRLTLAAADYKSPMTIADILMGERPGTARISPDGKYIMASTVIRMEKNTNRYIYNIYEYNTGKTVLTQEGKGWDWMPRGSRLTYTVQTSKGRSLRILDLADMKETIVDESLPEGGYRWSPDESFLIFTIQDKAAENKTGVNRILNPRDRQAGYRNRYFLAYYNLNEKILQPLTFGTRSTSLIAISPDSKSILFGSSKNNFTERPFSVSSYYLLDLATMQTDTLWNDIKYGRPYCFSPDSKQLLLTGGPESFDGIGLDPKVTGIPNSYDTQAYIYDLQSRTIKPITKHFDPSIKSAVWSKVDNNIYFTVDEKDRVTCYRYIVKNDRFEKLPLPVDVLLQLNMAKDNLAAAFTGVSASYPSRLFKTDFKTRKTTLLLDPMEKRMKEISLGEVTDWDFRSSQGDTISGFYCLPYNFDPEKKYPLIVYYYGGTTPTTRYFDSRYSFHLYASMGYVVYVLQPSGTIGYGQEFSARHVNAWGKRTADDIIEGTTRFCKEHTFVDPAKIGCIGASYGGFMTMYLQTRTDMFAAAVSHAGISDITSYWGEGYWGYSYNSAAAADSYPWNNRELFVDQSPLFSADKIKTPILFTHGAADTNVPVGESIQMFTALKLLGKPTELLTFDGENHGIVDTDKRTMWQKSIFAWFARWLQDDDAWWNDLYPASAD